MIVLPGQRCFTSGYDPERNMLFNGMVLLDGRMDSTFL